MWQENLKLVLHVQERRQHHHSLWSWSLCPRWGAETQAWSEHCNSQHLCRMDCFVTPAIEPLPLCCDTGRTHRHSPGATLCHFSRTASVFLSRGKLPQLLLAWKKLHLCTTSFFAEETTCREFSESRKTSCPPPAPSHLVLPAVPFSHSSDFPFQAHLLQVLVVALVYFFSERYFYPYY